MYSVFISQTRVSDHLARHIVSKTPSLPGLVRTVLACQRSSKNLQQFRVSAVQSPVGEGDIIHRDLDQERDNNYGNKT